MLSQLLLRKSLKIPRMAKNVLKSNIKKFDYDEGKVCVTVVVIINAYHHIFYLLIWKGRSNIV